MAPKLRVQAGLVRAVADPLPEHVAGAVGHPVVHERVGARREAEPAELRTPREVHVLAVHEVLVEAAETCPCRLAHAEARARERREVAEAGAPERPRFGGVRHCGTGPVDRAARHDVGGSEQLCKPADPRAVDHVVGVTCHHQLVARRRDPGVARERGAGATTRLDDAERGDRVLPRRGALCGPVGGRIVDDDDLERTVVVLVGERGELRVDSGRRVP